MEIKKPTRPLQYIYYKDRYDNWYIKHTKDELRDIINPLEPATFIPILKEMDYPYIEAIWSSCLLKEIQHSCESLNCKPKYTIFGKYIEKMKLYTFKNLTFKDSEYNKDLTKFHFYIGY